MQHSFLWKSIPSENTRIATNQKLRSKLKEPITFSSKTRAYQESKKWFLLAKSISSGAQYVNLHTTIGRPKVKNMAVWPMKMVLAQHNCIACSGWWKVKEATLCTCRKECKKCDLTAAQYFWLAHHNDWSTWFAISSSPPICCPSSSFIGGVAKKVNN
jgi:hypothetical protein